MHAVPLSLMLCSWLAGQTAAHPDLGFHPEALPRWQGRGFVVTQTNGGARPDYWISSQDQNGTGHKAMLQQVFLVPAGAGVIRFRAYAARGQGCTADDRLDVALMAAGKRIVPKWVRTGNAWQPVSSLLPPKDGHAQEYIWRVGECAGQYLRIVLVDEDDRPGCYVVCSGFQMMTSEEFETRDFRELMVRLGKQHQLAPMKRYESVHFLAWSNAEEHFSQTHLADCELLYSLFWDHFHRKGFRLRPPLTKLMVAMFDSQAGFNAYLGRKESPLVVGMYHPFTNRFVLYDYGQNESYLSMKDQAERQAKQITSQPDRLRWIETVQRRANDVRTDINISTIMHEVAHQLSYNFGMLNRDGDVPFWLAEGLACYCEATQNGSWQGIGELNPQRIAPLRTLLGRGLETTLQQRTTPQQRGKLIQLTELIRRDDLLQAASDRQTRLLAYAQSWALFRLLMEEQPQNVRSYLQRIYPQRIRDRRMADFQQAFGADLAGLQHRYEAYVRKIIQ
jgi:hypothetical protein